MLDQGNRTFIGSVVFVDIVGYSKKTVSEQIDLKDRFTGLLSDSLRDIPVEQRLILDTGDGAALSFLGDPEDALFVSMSMRDLVKRFNADVGALQPSSIEEAEAGIAGHLLLRIGINLGPVKLVRDINGHPNIVGDGINVAQRIMSFSQPGQIVVSRSFYDVVSVISDEYGKLFKYEGSRTDKHVREHEIYIVGESDAAFSQAKAGMEDRAAATNPKARGPGVGTGTFSHLPEDPDAPPLPFLQDKKKLTIAGGTLAAVVLALFLALVMKRSPEKAPEPVVIVKPDKPAAAPEKTEIVKTDAPGTTSEPAKPADAAAAPASTTNSAGAPAATAGGTPGAGTTGPDGKTPAGQTGAAKPELSKAEQAKADAAKAANVGVLKFNISPWGDIYVNGKSVGVAPPPIVLKLAPGKYRVEVKNTSFTPYTTNVEIKAKEEVVIKHKFQ
jgi:class 3 adenylate cyclase